MNQMDSKTKFMNSYQSDLLCFTVALSLHTETATGHCRVLKFCEQSAPPPPCCCDQSRELCGESNQSPFLGQTFFFFFNKKDLVCKVKGDQMVHVFAPAGAFCSMLYRSWDQTLKGSAKKRKETKTRITLYCNIKQKHLRCWEMVSLRERV